jgi:hypothetical protein
MLRGCEKGEDSGRKAVIPLLSRGSIPANLGSLGKLRRPANTFNKQHFA